MGQGQSAGTSGARKAVRFYFNGSRVNAFEGDTVACALVRAGVHIFSRSMKFHRPRGLYCGAGRCVSCAMRVNGVPWVRTCTLPVAEGMMVESQGGLPTTRFDSLSVLDHVFRKEFEYRTRFIRPRFLTPVYQRVVRRLAAASSLPARQEKYPRVTERSCNVLVIGQGVSGSVASARLRGADLRGVIAIDRMQGSEDRIPSVAFGAYEGGEYAVQVGEAVQILNPRVVLLATGRFETGLPLVNSDLPGVLLPEALSQLASKGVVPGRRAVVVGRNERHQSVLRNLEVLGVRLAGDIEDSSRISRVIGGTRVRGVQLASPRQRMSCDTVVVMGPLLPAVELARQAGCEMTSKDGFVRVKTDVSGRTTVPSVFACGGVAGFISPAERTRSAERAADAIAQELGVG